jgi:hypothetical protein
MRTSTEVCGKFQAKTAYKGSQSRSFVLDQRGTQNRRHIRSKSPACVKLVQLGPPVKLRRHSLTCQQQICREAFVWYQLKHPNVTQLYGLANLEFSSWSGLPCMVIPYSEHRDLWDFLCNFEDGDLPQARHRAVRVHPVFTTLSG